MFFARFTANGWPIGTLNLCIVFAGHFQQKTSQIVMEPDLVDWSLIMYPFSLISSTKTQRTLGNKHPKVRG